jgi:hypothetical protein
MIRENKERNWNDELRTWRGTLHTRVAAGEGRHGILGVPASVVNNTRWGWLPCVFSVINVFISVAVSQFKCLLLCLTRKWAFAFVFAYALHYVLRAGETEPVDNCTSCRFLENKKMDIIQRLLAHICEVFIFC